MCIALLEKPSIIRLLIIFDLSRSFIVNGKLYNNQQFRALFVRDFILNILFFSAERNSVNCWTLAHIMGLRFCARSTHYLS